MKTEVPGTVNENTAVRQYEGLTTQEGELPQPWHHLRTTKGVAVEAEKEAAAAVQPPAAGHLRRT